MSEIANQYKSLLDEAMAIQTEIIGLRREIHMHPELGKEEFRTAELVETYLQALNIETERVTETGVIGLLKGDQPGKTVGIRADMDALPVQELNQVEYISQSPGRMHACGHDAHTAALLGTAKILAAHRHELRGNIKFFFQPNEEQDGGAKDMIAAGGLENPKVDAIFGCHVNPEIPAGKLGVSYGKSYAASNPFDIIIRGQGSHGAVPHKGIDTIVIASQIVTALQSIVSRNVDPLDSAVVTIGSFQGGTQRNIIAQETCLSGIIRTLDSTSRKKIVESVERIARGIGESMNAEIEFKIQHSYPALFNDSMMTDLVKDSASHLLGEENVLVLHKPTLGTEDFSYFLEKVQGSFYQLGIGNSKLGTEYPLHSGHFNIDESALPLAAAVHAQVAMDYLKKR